MPVKFSSSTAFQQKVDNYFRQFCTDIPPTDKKADSPTFCGMILYLGFTSREEFGIYEQQGRFAETARKARLQIEAEYEKRLHLSSPTGAVFALRSMGWGGEQPYGSVSINQPLLQIEVKSTGILPANSEGEVGL
ncbi:hypothetical protein LJ707_12630 [Mucilaginibacter sp. UR6-1]|uniref:terminase small subunit n=1 Tax=Mucilaginibacter sp. UR6-1 TaxID=1435643 RepID=UPI001E30E14F|nr:terminase small subunit [Mucilaginibacter sp. UR6-1]MCC8409777.1 hypothetical protein [Mucilaginibacter sp. UR6-1]